METMDRPGSSRVERGWRGWKWLALSLTLVGGCKPDDFTGSSAADMTADELLAHLKLTGVLRDGSREWALLLLAVPGRPTEYLKLMPGQRVGELEIRTIDHARGTVGVQAGDRAATLSEATHGLRPEDGYAWLQRLTPDEHARFYNSPERQELVDDHAAAQAERQRKELERELDERRQLAPPSDPDHLLESP
jgi:hypothetical protein